MSIVDERSRHQLYVTLESVLGHEEADTMMAMLPPVGWADVATKHDLLALEERIVLRFATKDDLHAAFRTMLLTMVGLFLAQTSLLLTVLVTTR